MQTLKIPRKSRKLPSIKGKLSGDNCIERVCNTNIENPLVSWSAYKRLADFANLNIEGVPEHRDRIQKFEEFDHDAPSTIFTSPPFLCKQQFVIYSKSTLEGFHKLSAVTNANSIRQDFHSAIIGVHQSLTRTIFQSSDGLRLPPTCPNFTFEKPRFMLRSTRGDSELIESHLFDLPVVVNSR